MQLERMPESVSGVCFGCRRREYVCHAPADPALHGTKRERSAGLLLIHGKIVSDFKESRARQNQQGLIICY